VKGGYPRFMNILAVVEQGLTDWRGMPAELLASLKGRTYRTTACSCRRVGLVRSWSMNEDSHLLDDRRNLGDYDVQRSLDLFAVGGVVGSSPPALSPRASASVWDDQFPPHEVAQMIGRIRPVPQELALSESKLCCEVH
jgi:hypothetical protein